ncbi:MAG: DUF2797 domain-containing protein [Gammaproteobacteria bacterium]|nr:DUF2797 domain-containing protein [Gammaproteobacteria bacterium]
MQGPLHKMHTQLAQPVEYRLRLGDATIDLHQQLDKTLRLTWQQRINCIHCGRETNKSFNQGFCYPCFRSLAQCDICIVAPEKCHYDQGTCREPEWALQHCMQDHHVYLSNTSGVKVGITRYSQLPTRWIDQGAVQALSVIRVSQRYHAGLVETAFKPFLSDKTNWRSMLKNEYQQQDLHRVFAEVWPQVAASLEPGLMSDISLIADSENIQSISYPALHFPDKISSFNLEKTPQVEGRLIAIKGQYLLFDSGVINIRKYAGYQVSLEVLSA